MGLNFTLLEATATIVLSALSTHAAFGIPAMTALLVALFTIIFGQLKGARLLCWLRCVNLSPTFSTCSGTLLGGSSCVELVRGYGWEHLEMHQMYRFDVWMIWVIELLVTFKKLFWLYILSDSSKRLAKQGTLSVQLPHLPVFWASWPATFVGDDCSCTSRRHKPNIGHLWPFRICSLRIKCFSNHAFHHNKVRVPE